MTDETPYEESEIDAPLREAMHSAGFFAHDEVEEREDGSTWVRVDFFDWMNGFIKKWLGLKDEKGE